MIDLYESHKKDGDKFEILAFHDGTAKDFAELDKNLPRTRKRYWGGRDLPFPVLLDATGQTIKDWGVRAFPTMLLIDPEGKLVGEVSEEELEKKLPAQPLSVRIERGLDRGVRLGVKDPTLEGACMTLSRVSRLPIRLDENDLKAAGISYAEARVPFTWVGSISLRSALALLLEADGLTYERDDEGLVIRTRKDGASPPEPLSERQRTAIKRIEKELDKKVSFDFKAKPLAEVARFFDEQIDESFVLSPRDRKAGRLDPKKPVSGSAKDVPIREALKALLEPIGVSYTIRDELVVLTAKPKATPGK